MTETEVEKSKELAKLSKELKSAENKVEQYKGFLESDIKFGRETSHNRIKLEYAQKEYDKVKKEIDKLM